ncbi:peptidyl-prolyl cis-trans isomerase B (cyclophilin B) [Actinomadura pelletieri DSM 43383]|uniref:Peptidyl-prolyl cis-trans isomerase n=1 Tax=Actinomadura pelletieri DSM 43383 TaxID=1120940 RepID=A0A495QUE6_9ACTN|nr:peptidylprolyl isomerase [Actinomadura pelletieri]RKS77146.1 peptidyl-prolyl cis-trans isomerase B (cyclophilin B) [Actinomadura pelletieri DSM 43383]
MRPRWTVTALAVVLAAALVPAGTAQAAPSGGGHKARCEFRPTPKKPPAKTVRLPRPTAPARGDVDVVIATNFGDVVIEMDRRNAPCAVHNFESLSRQRFYDRTRCWRLTNSPRLGVLQCGDIFAAEEGGPGYEFDDELTGKETYPRGTVAMGNWGPDTNGSQFFLVHSRADIPPAYTVLGKVTRGLSVLDRIVKGGITPGPNGPNDGEPTKPVKIHRVLVHG